MLRTLYSLTTIIQIIVLRKLKVNKTKGSLLFCFMIGAFVLGSVLFVFLFCFLFVCLSIDNEIDLVN